MEWHLRFTKTSKLHSSLENAFPGRHELLGLLPFFRTGHHPNDKSDGYHSADGREEEEMMSTITDGTTSANDLIDAIDRELSNWRRRL